MKFVLITFWGLMLILTACTNIESSSEMTLAAETAVPTSTPSQAPTTTETAINQPTSTQVVVTLTPPKFEVCSPLEDETFETLPLIISKPLDIPGFGQDTGHHGVDFAYFKRGDRISIEGIEIYSIFNGTTVLTLEDDNPLHPYGYTILIETPLKQLPGPLQQELLEGYLDVPDDPHYRLYCPDVTNPVVNGDFSVYHLYAHLEEIPPFTRGEEISCGTTLGTVGNTGQSSNPHLHLETRLGPSNAGFTNMAHYDTFTLEELSNYCLWRMSGYYQLFDPFLLFDAVD
jgi:murein DD-endopeptidase MepM/ murein hydrolase activator NlpD